MSDLDQHSQGHRGEQPLRIAICQCGQKYLISEDRNGSTIACHRCGEVVLLTGLSKAAADQSTVEATTPIASAPEITPPSPQKTVAARMPEAGLMFWCLTWCKLHFVEVAASLVVHAAAALVMVSILLEHQQVSELQPLSATIELAEPELGDVSEVVLTDLKNLDSASSDIAPPLPQLTASVLPVTDTFVNEMPDLKFQAPAAENSTTQSKGGSSKKGRGRGNGEGDGNGNGGTSFFGKKLTVDSIAYVIDASGSMQGDRFRRARQELVNALKEMRSNQRFYIVFYTDQTYPLFWPNPVVELQPATTLNLQRTMFWLEKAKTSGGTSPQKAMRIALALKPDVVFLLSDGDIPPETLGIVLQENKRSVIHTIALGSNKGAVVMKQIAAENKGEFKFIPD
jgi:DNA-directed RNA polymerase subunit RPC12/RpoP